MTLYERIETLRKAKNISQGKLEKELGFSNGSISKWKHSSPTTERLQKLADYFGVTAEYLLTGKEPQESAAAKPKPPRDVESILNITREQLLSQDGLMFDGKPASPEAVESIISAMQIGMEMAKLKNKEKYTPKKYRNKKE